MNKIILIVFLLSGCVINLPGTPPVVTEPPVEPPVTPPVVTLLPVSNHLTEVVLPVCDTSNPQVLIVENDADFARINDEDKSIFCVKAGNYNAELKITRNGTAEAPRYIRHFSDDTHPEHQPEAARAVIKSIFFLGAAHWIVDKTTVRGTNIHSSIRMQPRLPYNPHWPDDPNHIILNELLVEGSGGASGMIAMGGYNLTIQNSVIRNTFVVPKQDDHCIVFYGRNNKVVNNEIYNCAGDGLQTSGSGSPDGIIADNEIYVNSDFYTNGDGIFNPEGEFMCSEGALAFKGGGAESKELLVSGNLIYGYHKKNDRNCATGGGGITAVITQRVASYIQFEKNIILDSFIGIVAATNTTTKIVFDNNLFHKTQYAFSFPPKKSHDNTFTNNFMIEPKLFFPVTGFDPQLFLGIGEDNVISGNTDVLDKEVCFNKNIITNPQQVCINETD